MAKHRAKTLDEKMFDGIMNYVKGGNDPERDTVILFLSFKAGLRAKEISGLEWEDLTDAQGEIRSDAIFVPSDIAKGKRERTVPMHPKLFLALHLLRNSRPKCSGKVVYGGKSCKQGMTANSLCVWLHRLYAGVGLEGCSSHSGRRTFITNLARKAGLHNCSLRDVQMLAGHKSIQTTEKYIDISPNVDKLVSAI